MTNRRRLVGLITLALLAAAYPTYLFLSRSHPSHDVFLEMNLGMAKADVRIMLGGLLARPDKTKTWPWGNEEIWLSDDGAVLVVFDHYEKLSYKEWIEHMRRKTAREMLSDMFWPQRVRE